MRGSRAKKLRKQALANPAPIQTAFYNGTLVYGGKKREYKELKLRWKNKSWDKRWL